jgi:CRP-like cAMP-binding protein
LKKKVELEPRSSLLGQEGSTMHVTVEQLQRILLLSGLDLDQLAQLQAHAVVKQYVRGETILYEGDRLPAQLFAVLSGRIEIKKTASTGKDWQARLFRIIQD